MLLEKITHVYTWAYFNGKSSTWYTTYRAFQVALVAKKSPANSGDIRDAGSTPGREDPLEEVNEGMATHSSILAWRILWTEEPGRLQSIELQRVGHD